MRSVYILTEISTNLCNSKALGQPDGVTSRAERRRATYTTNTNKIAAMQRMRGGGGLRGLYRWDDTAAADISQPRWGSSCGTQSEDWDGVRLPVLMHCLPYYMHRGDKNRVWLIMAILSWLRAEQIPSLCLHRQWSLPSSSFTYRFPCDVPFDTMPKATRTSPLGPAPSSTMKLWVQAHTYSRSAPSACDRVFNKA